MYRFRLFCLMIACGLVFATQTPAYAIDYFVDGSCGSIGDGRADACAGSSGGSGAFTDPQSCFLAARAGDTCYIKNGTYITTNKGTDTSNNGGFSVAASGTASSPIIFRNYPGHSPLLANCPSSATDYGSCSNPTITAENREYVVFDGFRVRGGIWLYGANMAVGAGSRGVIIRNLDISQGWGEINDGNWAALFLQNLTGALIQNNFIHDISVTSGGGQQSSGGCIKLYQNTDSVIEKNTCLTVRITESQAGGIDDKAQAVRNIHRFNWIQDVNTCIRINNQLNSTGVQIYGNVCVGGAGTLRPAIRLITNIDSVTIYNNTLYGFAQGLQVMNEGGPVTNVRYYNNIVSQSPTNLEMYQPALALSNFNAWKPGSNYSYNSTNYSGLAAFRSATGLDAQSTETDCRFVSPGSDFHLVAGSPCAATGRTGGTTAGSAVDRGAYGVTACVGQACGGQGSTNPPAAPANLTILR